VILFLASVARFYHPGTGFTALLGLPAGHDSEAPVFRAIPHYDYPAWASYDGQFYVQRALDPLIRDPEVDRAMDLAPFRARRILFSWTAYLVGLGRPAWIVQVYALQNVVCWLLLAALLTRWMPLTSGRGLAVWAACLFSHGMLWSVRFALLDGPSVVLTACAVIAVERGRPLASAIVTGMSALGRETNLLSILAQPVPSDRRGWARLGIGLAIAALPILIWYDYLRSIYRSTLLAGTNQLVLAGSGISEIWRGVLVGIERNGLFSGDGLSLCLMLSLAVQAIYLIVRREYPAPWWRVAVGYALLMLTLDRVLANPHTGAITRVLLPLTVGFNVLLAREPRTTRFWPWFVAGNLHLLATFRVMPLTPW
ncbi:MAG: hypothetical protein ACRD15_05280, partial [Vicinamibacterales bacterium]